MSTENTGHIAIIAPFDTESSLVYVRRTEYYIIGVFVDAPLTLAARW